MSILIALRDQKGCPPVPIDPTNLQTGKPDLKLGPASSWPSGGTGTGFFSRGGAEARRVFFFHPGWIPLICVNLRNLRITLRNFRKGGVSPPNDQAPSRGRH